MLKMTDSPRHGICRVSFRESSFFFKRAKKTIWLLDWWRFQFAVWDDFLQSQELSIFILFHDKILYDLMI